MSKQAFAINMEEAATFMEDEYAKDVYVLERSQHPGIRLLYGMNESDFRTAGHDVLLTSLIQTLRTTDKVRDLGATYQPEYATLPLSVEAKRYLEKVASVKDDTRALGKIVARAALSISEGKDYEEVIDEVASMHSAFVDDLTKQITKDQERNPLYIEVDGVTHEILAEAGRTLVQLEDRIKEIAPSLTKEQRDYIIQSYDQGSAAGAGSDTLAKDGEHDDGSKAYHIRGNAVSTNVRIDGDKILVNIDLKYAVNDEDLDNAWVIVTTLHTDITSLRSNESKLPGLASAKIAPTLTVTYVGDKDFIKAPEYATSGIEAQRHLGDYCARELRKSGLLDGISTPEGMKEIAKFIKGYPKELRNEMISAIGVAPEYRAEHTTALIKEFALDAKEQDKVYALTIFKQDKLEIVSELITAILKARVAESGELEYGDIAESLRESITQKQMTSEGVDILTRNVAESLGMNGAQSAILHSIVLVKEAREQTAMTKEMLSARLTGVAGREEGEKLIEEAARGENVGRFIPVFKMAKNLFKRSSSSPSKMVWTPVEGLSTPTTPRSPSSTPSSPMFGPGESEFNPNPFEDGGVPAVATPKIATPRPGQSSQRKPSFVERYAPDRAQSESPKSFVEQVSGEGQAGPVKKVGKE